jgi:hypothetical protein
MICCMSKRIHISGSACNTIGGPKEVMAGLDRMQEVLEKGRVVEVKATARRSDEIVGCRNAVQC